MVSNLIPVRLKLQSSAVLDIVKTNWHVLPQVSFGGVIIPNSDIVKNLEIYIEKSSLRIYKYKVLEEKHSPLQHV